MSLIHIEDLSKHFQILNRRDGLSGAFRFAFTCVITYWIWTKGVNSYTGTGS